MESTLGKKVGTKFTLMNIPTISMKSNIKEQENGLNQNKVFIKSNQKFSLPTRLDFFFYLCYRLFQLIHLSFHKIIIHPCLNFLIPHRLFSKDLTLVVASSITILKNLNFETASFMYLLAKTFSIGIPVSHSKQNSP